MGNKYLDKEFKSILHFNLAISLFVLDKIFFALKELDRALVIDIKIGEVFIKKGFDFIILYP